MLERAIVYDRSVCLSLCLFVRHTRDRRLNGSIEILTSEIGDLNNLEGRNGRYFSEFGSFWAIVTSKWSKTDECCLQQKCSLKYSFSEHIRRYSQRLRRREAPHVKSDNLINIAR